jgi:UDP-N-acetylglucosamine--N-acetylmuramyl-(pentapeptide) pyrophosphoryl-undecaprenol N-acetylglucosamine transferase
VIVLCAGGTGGHVFPAEGLASALKKRGYKLALLTDSRAMNFVNYEYFDA